MGWYLLMRKQNEIIFIEPYCDKEQHAKLNAGLIFKYSQEYSKIKFFGTKSQINAVTSILKDKENNVSYIIIEELPKNEFMSSLKFFYKIFKENKGDIFICSTNTFHLITLSLINILFKKRINILAHAVLENSLLVTLKDKILFFRRFPFWLKIYTTSNLNTVVLLSKSILKNFLIEYDVKKESCIVIDSPYVIDLNILDSKFIEKKLPLNEIKIGFLGIGTNEKGLDWLITQLNKNILNKCKFYLLGKNITGIKSKNLIEPFNEWIPDQEYNEIINSMHYFIFPFPNYLYKLRSSGTLLDAIK